MAEAKAPKPFRAGRALQTIVSDASSRTVNIVSGPVTKLFAVSHLFNKLPAVLAGYPSLNDSSPSYVDFVAGEPGDPTQSQLIEADVNNFIATSMNYAGWVNRAKEIRKSGVRATCIRDLSAALNVGAAYSVGMSSANTLLSLIPTAGVLIGAPAKELWVLYKLCPLAGILSILLSLGGSIVPTEVNDYEKLYNFEYQGLVASADQLAYDQYGQKEHRTEAQEFADQVYNRARSATGSRPFMYVGAGMIIQATAIVAILVACWFLESGAVIVWWCEAWYWMFVWYGITAFSSILENFAGVPFTRTWTIRVWRSPRDIEIDVDSPWVIKPDDEEEYEEDHDYNPNSQYDPLMENVPLGASGREKSRYAEPVVLEQVRSGSSSRPQLQKRVTATIQGRHEFNAEDDVLRRLEKGYSNNASIWIDPTKPLSQADDAFYVMLSVKGVEEGHAALRVVSKVVSIGVFAVSTALFASATLITILEAVTAASLILCAGIFGRVTAMWMVSTMMKNQPVLHRVVRDRGEASKYLEAIFRKPEIACEVKGHIIISGRCVKKFGRHIRLSTILGVLAAPYDLAKLGLRGAAARYGMTIDRSHVFRSTA